jgi:hypothetical protein
MRLPHKTRNAFWTIEITVLPAFGQWLAIVRLKLAPRALFLRTPTEIHCSPPMTGSL